jgi:hypothetical protein
VALAAFAVLLSLGAATAAGMSRLPAHLLPSARYLPGMVPGSTYIDDFPTRPPVRCHINRQGFRDVDRADRPARRVLLAGDSCVFGNGVEFPDTLSQQLERRLAARLGPDVEVYNLGVPGLSLRSTTEVAARMAAEVGCDALGVGYLSPLMASRYDMPWRRQELARPGLYRLAAALLGEEAVSFLLQARALEQPSYEIVPDAVRELRRVAAGHGCPLIVFCYGQCRELEGQGIEYVALNWGPNRPEMVILGDGHPTAAGNAELAALLERRLLPELARRRPRPRPAALPPG